jgi:cell division protein FtsB
MARERIAREELGLAKPGEVVILLPREEEQEAD